MRTCGIIAVAWGSGGEKTFGTNTSTGNIYFSLIWGLKYKDLSIVAGPHILHTQFPLAPALIRGTPFRDNGYLTQEELTYNKVHASSRAFIERAFGRLKGKFRRLKYLELHKSDYSSIIVCAACILHNFILKEEPVTIDDENVDEEENVNADINLNLAINNGVEKLWVRGILSCFQHK
ncbi:hypothetical protein NQ315_016251 [Exocentrus adspersus]|uniref:DDE Tnp4 domain-containing protein n=1 Tax=Exocentrus adspersus TaxID=1586481 RepID=A0AAV8VJ65_9CUCU|nr:hypothetical protein NQ315_016251 [Exocentrus adspersus]